MISSVRFRRSMVSIALAHTATFVILAGASQVSAANVRPTRGEMERICHEEGGVYWEDYYGGVVIDYGCDFPDGDTWMCSGDGETCLWTTWTSSPSQASDPTYGDPYLPASTAPADSYQSGYEYQIAGQ